MVVFEVAGKQWYQWTEQDGDVEQLSLFGLITFGSKFLKRAVHADSKFCNLVRQDSFENYEVNGEILVYQAVSQSDDLAPGNVGMICPVIVWYVAGCFAYYLKASHDSAFEHLIQSHQCRVFL
jgi:hypothetical protein